MRISDLLRQPYPPVEISRGVQRYIFFSVFIILFLFLFKPFGMGGFTYGKSYLIAGYGICTFFAMAAGDGLAFRFYPTAFVEDAWVVYKHIIWISYHCILVGLANYAYAVLIGAFSWDFPSFLRMEGYVALCTMLPLALFVLIRQNHLLRRNDREAGKLEAEREESRLVAQVEKIRLWAENKMDYLDLDASGIFYIHSMDNYAQIVHRQNGLIQKTILRSSLSAIEDQLMKEPTLYRCHRSYIVNIKKISSIKGNAQGYTLILDGPDLTVPVSRSKGKGLHERL